MCTVTYLPYNKREFILTSNRDELVSRPAALPVKAYKTNNGMLYYPMDAKAFGTWIACSENGFVICLLNGATKPHQPRDTYRKSRGIVLLDFYQYENPKDFTSKYDFTDIEPFTLIMAYSCSDTEKVILHELRWDGITPELVTHDSSLPRIWSSATLYSPDIIEERKDWFNSWLEKHQNYTPDNILFFHHFAGVGTADNDLIINRGDKRTVSVCCINKNVSYSEIIYEDILNKKMYKNKIINC